MPNHTEVHIPYLQHRLRREISELYVTVGIKNLAVAMITLYEPLFLYNLGFSLKTIALIYVFCFGIYFFALPLGGKIAVKYGFEHSILYSIPFKILYYIILYSVSFTPVALILFPFIFAFEKALYWPAYHAGLAYYGNRFHRGKELGVLKVIVLAVTVVGPFLGGLVLRVSNFATLFIVVSILFFISIIPLFTTKERFKPGSFSYSNAFRRLFAKKDRKKFLGYLGFGEEAIAIVFWPIFIFLILKNYFSIGIVISLASGLTILVMLYIGKLADTKHRKRTIRLGSILSLFVWILRMFVQNSLSIFCVDALAKIARSMLSISIFTQAYERAEKTTRYMKTVIFFTQALNLGKTLICLLVFVVLYFTSNLVFTFIPAALVSLLYMVL